MLGPKGSVTSLKLRAMEPDENCFHIRSGIRSAPGLRMKTLLRWRAVKRLFSRCDLILDLLANFTHSVALFKGIEKGATGYAPEPLTIIMQSLS
jgi:hypothetical protein